MQDNSAKTLRGLTWKHDRGLAPLLATATHFCKKHPEVKIQWETRSLQEFGEGSMIPKVRSAVEFVRTGGERAVIAALEDGLDALEGRAGTTITEDR